MRGKPGGFQPDLAVERIDWTVDPSRRLTVIVCRGGVTDADLLTRVPMMWERHPEALDYITVVDARGTTQDGGWTWPALREIARRRQALGRPRPAGKRIAFVTSNRWIAMLVKGLDALFPGIRVRCFTEPGPAVEWAERR